ncbi:unnamed protein product [Chrysoparadoxa australica]
MFPSLSLPQVLAATPQDWDGQTNAIGGRPDERRGSWGCFQHGLTVLAGGEPPAFKPPKKEASHGKVLYRSKMFKPKMAEASYNSSRPDERFEIRNVMRQPILAGGRPHDVPVAREIPHGEVLYTSARLHHPKPTSYVNERGERRGRFGSFTKGQPVLDGGVARDFPVTPEFDHGIMLPSC